MAKRIEALIVCFSVIVWLLPLGVFIKPSEEKVACGGKRALHMCTMNMKARTQDSGQGLKITSGSGQIDKQNPASGGGNDYVLNSRIRMDREWRSWCVAQDPILRRSILPSGIEHVPKH